MYSRLLLILFFILPDILEADTIQTGLARAEMLGDCLQALLCHGYAEAREGPSKGDKPFPQPSRKSRQRKEQHMETLVSNLLQLLRLYCCSFRRALRHATKDLNLRVKEARAPQNFEGKAMATRAYLDGVFQDIICLVEVTVNAVATMESVCFSDKLLSPFPWNLSLLTVLSTVH